MCRQHWRGTRSLLVLGAKQLRDRGIERSVERVRKSRTSIIQPGVHAIAVVLDFVQPSIAHWRFVYDARQLRLNPFRWPDGFPHAEVQHISCATYSD